MLLQNSCCLIFYSLILAVTKSSLNLEIIDGSICSTCFLSIWGHCPWIWVKSGLASLASHVFVMITSSLCIFWCSFFQSCCVPILICCRGQLVPFYAFLMRLSGCMAVWPRWQLVTLVKVNTSGYPVSYRLGLTVSVKDIMPDFAEATTNHDDWTWWLDTSKDIPLIPWSLTKEINIE